LGIHILEIEITTRCNLNCKHCYNRNLKNIDFPLDKFEELYNFANKYRIWTFVISGGEALLHPRFEEVVAFIKRTPHNFRLVLQTNGKLINQENTIEKIKIFDLIHISFDLTEEVRLGSSQNFLLSKELLKHGVKSYLFSTIHKANRHLIDDMLKKAQEVNVPIGFNICIPTKKLNPQYLMTRSEFMETEKKLYSLFLEGKILRYSSPLVSLFDNKKTGRKGIKGGCSAGVAACVISSSGELYPCPFLRTSAGNIFKTPLIDLWLDSEFFNKIRDRGSFSEPCGSCDKISYCGGCRNRALVETGNIQGADPMCYKNQLIEINYRVVS